jgi:hypothetical protein
MQLAPRPGGPEEHTHPRLAFLVGLACWGADAATSRARAWSASLETSSAASAPGSPEEARLRARGLLLGLSMTIVVQGRSALKRGRAAAVPVGRGLRRLGQAGSWIPGMPAVVRRAAALRARTALSVRRIAARGELEAARCQRLARIGVAEIVDGSLGAMAGATQVREVLLEQSAGLVGEAVVEVRRRAERADSRLETALRSLLGRRRQPAAPGPPTPTGQG